jgi:hypothetical protein
MIEDYIRSIYPAMFSTWVSVHQHKDSERRATALTCVIYHIYTSAAVRTARHHRIFVLPLVANKPRGAK